MIYHKLILVHLLLILIVGCSKNKSKSILIPGDHGSISAAKNKSFFDDVGVLKPYNPKSPFNEAISDCVYSNYYLSSCSLSKLPLIGMSTNKITVNDILDRTIISHEYLGSAFKQALMRMDPEILRMFGSVNSIVISDKINPSFYSGSSGAIYLDADYFWSKVDEFEISNQPKGAEVDYVTSLQFGEASDYIKDKKSISFTKQENIRTNDEIFFPLMCLLFHELAHANDYFPSSFYLDTSSLDLTKTYYDTIAYRAYRNQLLSNNQPSLLASKKLRHFGKILYRGEPLTEEDKLTLATDIANEFKNDLATDFYSYTTPLEDFAMNTEESLMLYFFNVYKIVGVVKFPYSNFIVPEGYGYPIIWGQKGRVLIPEIKMRVLYALKNILGDEFEQQVSQKFQNLSVEEIPENTLWEDIYKL